MTAAELLQAVKDFFRSFCAVAYVFHVADRLVEGMLGAQVREWHKKIARLWLIDCIFRGNEPDLDELRKRFKDPQAYHHNNRCTELPPMKDMIRRLKLSRTIAKLRDLRTSELEPVLASVRGFGRAYLAFLEKTDFCGEMERWGNSNANLLAPVSALIPVAHHGMLQGDRKACRTVIEDLLAAAPKVRVTYVLVNNNNYNRLKRHLQTLIAQCPAHDCPASQWMVKYKTTRADIEIKVTTFVHFSQTISLPEKSSGRKISFRSLVPHGEAFIRAAWMIGLAKTAKLRPLPGLGIRSSRDDLLSDPTAYKASYIQLIGERMDHDDLMKTALLDLARYFATPQDMRELLEKADVSQHLVNLLDVKIRKLAAPHESFPHRLWTGFNAIINELLTRTLPG